jgi:GAF domain-containing protein
MSRELRQLTTLYRLTRLLAMGTQGDSLLRTILKEALGLTGARGAQVLLLKPDRKTLISHIGEGEGAPEGLESPADDAPWAAVIHQGKIVRLCPWSEDGASHADGRRVTLGLPLLARGDVLGVLTLYALPEIWARQGRTSLLEALANLAAHALTNSTLYRDLLRQKEELCTLIEVSRDIAASLDLDEVLRRVVRHATRLLHVQTSALMLVDEGGQRLRLSATYGGGR